MRRPAAWDYFGHGARPTCLCGPNSRCTPSLSRTFKPRHRRPDDEQRRGGLDECVGAPSGARSADHAADGDRPLLRVRDRAHDGVGADGQRDPVLRAVRAGASRRPWARSSETVTLMSGCCCRCRRWVRPPSGVLAGRQGPAGVPGPGAGQRPVPQRDHRDRDPVRPGGRSRGPAEQRPQESSAGSAPYRCALPGSPPCCGTPQCHAPSPGPFSCASTRTCGRPGSDSYAWVQLSPHSSGCRPPRSEVTRGGRRQPMAEGVRRTTRARVPCR